MSLVTPVIGVFDSGIGGLSILEAVRERLPQAHYVYLSDNAHFPYGIKSESEVVSCTLEATARLVARFGVDLLIIACNTASTVTLPRLRAQFKIPVIGVVPAIKPAVAMSRTRTIGLLATPGTVKSPYTDELIQQFAAAARVIKCGSGALVRMAEAKWRGTAPDLELLRAEVRPLFEESPTESLASFKRLDTVVLGCTHFPHLVPELNQVVPWPVQWVDSSQAIAARCHYLLEQGKILRTSPHEPALAPGLGAFCVTRMDGEARALAPVVIQLGFGRIEVLS